MKNNSTNYKNENNYIAKQDFITKIEDTFLKDSNNKDLNSKINISNFSSRNHKVNSALVNNNFISTVDRIKSLNKYVSKLNDNSEVSNSNIIESSNNAYATYTQHHKKLVEGINDSNNTSQSKYIGLIEKRKEISSYSNDNTSNNNNKTNNNQFNPYAFVGEEFKEHLTNNTNNPQSFMIKQIQPSIVSQTISNPIQIGPSNYSDLKLNSNNSSYNLNSKCQALSKPESSIRSTKLNNIDEKINFIIKKISQIVPEEDRNLNKYKSESIVKDDNNYIKINEYSGITENNKIQVQDRSKSITSGVKREEKDKASISRNLFNRNASTNYNCSNPYSSYNKGSNYLSSNNPTSSSKANTNIESDASKKNASLSKQIVQPMTKTTNTCIIPKSVNSKNIKLPSNSNIPKNKTHSSSVSKVDKKSPCNSGIGNINK
jgi:hypothetical protein